MRGKLMSVAAMLLLTWNSDSFAINAGNPVPAPETKITVKTAIPLPAVSERAELTQQLMEVALTGIHPVFADTWLQLTKQP